MWTWSHRVCLITFIAHTLPQSTGSHIKRIFSSGFSLFLSLFLFLFSSLSLSLSLLCLRFLLFLLTFTSGDDSGCVKVWDLRKQKAIFTFQEHTDYIADFLIGEHAMNSLVCCSGDGTLTVLHMRKGTLVAASDNQVKQMTCLT